MGLQFRNTAAEALIDAPCREIQILRPVVVTEQLRIQSDDVMDITVGHHDGIGLTQDVLPRTDGRRTLTDTDHARLTIIVAESTVRLLHHIGCPDHLGGRPVHDDVLPVDEVLAHPYLCRTVAVARAVGGGIEIIGITKLANGWIGEISRNKRICRRRGVISLALGMNAQRQTGQSN